MSKRPNDEVWKNESRKQDMETEALPRIYYGYGQLQTEVRSANSSKIFGQSLGAMHDEHHGAETQSDDVQPQIMVT